MIENKSITFSRCTWNLSTPLSMEDKVVRSSMQSSRILPTRSQADEDPHTTGGVAEPREPLHPQEPPKNQNFSTHIPSPHLPQSQCPKSNSLNPLSMVSKIKLSSSLVLHLLTSLIVGGASGIGKAMVEYFHSKGAKVVFGDLNDTNGKAIADKLGEYVRV